MAKATYRISHVTTYKYQQPVRVCHNIVILTPRTDGWASPLHHRVVIRPNPVVIHRRDDYFGNHIHSFSIEESHRQLIVSASGSVEVCAPELPNPLESQAWEEVRDSVIHQVDPRWLEVGQFRFNSPRIVRGAAFADYAASSFTPSRPVLDAALDLMRRIHSDFVYDTKATDVQTPTKEAFRLRRGVCQDFAHVQIACLRSLGLSARYVSGYLRTVAAPGQVKLVGSDQTHAWVSVYCGRDLGWVDLDATNNKAGDSDHIPIAWGRDYHDVVPVRGVFLGGGNHTITVSVDVTRVA